MKVASSIILNSDFKSYLLAKSLDYIIAQYPPAKKALFKECTLYFTLESMLYIFVSYWTAKDVPTIGDSTEYCFDLKLSSQFIQETPYLSAEEKKEFLEVQLAEHQRVTTIEMGSPFDGDPMFQE